MQGANWLFQSKQMLGTVQITEYYNTEHKVILPKQNYPYSNMLINSIQLKFHKKKNTYIISSWAILFQKKKNEKQNIELDVPFVLVKQ